ncbi:glycoside hydrolase family 9 protein [Vibrio sp. B1Z05]|uniref:glycoside hydrolase family 9 protein n=1 Tax=Vibrio sp. B1Z05 TaxID=2654980 RepID=UPI00128DFF8D|nr:glycoside hydrolase family 9 protein [Vibrio sp. B1Z05]MPW35016.1 chitobiase [Vibrio sp. B1Z05]
MQLLINQIGYSATAHKVGVLHAPSPLCLQKVDTADVVIIEVQTKQEVARVPLQPGQLVEQWDIGWSYPFDFSKLNLQGRFVARFEHVESLPFDIQPQLLYQRTFSDLLHYFKSQRCTGMFDHADKNVRIFGSDARRDVRGGWYDASGDVSKYLSHLCYANYLNPQQTPMLVWNLLSSLEVLSARDNCAPFTRTRLIDEALFGADFLVRMQANEGFFYTTVFDQWSKEPEKRELCAYKTQTGKKLVTYQAGFRQGAGIAIAALASAARLQQNGEYSSHHYQQAAQKGYWHLKEHNKAYLNDGKENIIDEYCALLASVELYKTTQDQRYLDDSRDWALRLTLRQHSDQNWSHFWSATAQGERPYFHPSDAGLPVIALCCFLDIETDSVFIEKNTSSIEAALSFELKITHATCNPYAYPRQYVKNLGGEKRDAFFMAQDNESGYWWQGENARLASLSAMAYRAIPYVSASFLKPLQSYAQSCLNWIIGLNPYNMCMLDGHGDNNPNYLPHLGFYNAKGGICNGITAGFNHPQGIAFNPTAHADDLQQNWRWAEQWLPHSAWFLLAVAYQTNDELSGDSP